MPVLGDVTYTITEPCPADNHCTLTITMRGAGRFTRRIAAKDIPAVTDDELDDALWVLFRAAYADNTWRNATQLAAGVVGKRQRLGLDV